MYFQNLLRVFAGVLLVATFVAPSLIPKAENIVEREISLSKSETGADKFHAKYNLDLNTKVITFEVTVETTGYVGFGLSPGRGMTGSDIVIGGVDENGNKYFMDRYGVGNEAPKIDDEQNWELLAASENDTHTFLRFSRLLETCDKEHDVPITDDTLSIIWSYGLTDEINKHVDRGTRNYNLINPARQMDVSNFDVWTVNHTMAMPSQTTTYWCTIHKAPKFDKKRHIVGFNTKIETKESLKHSHHLDLYQCYAPPGEDIDEVFGKFVGHPGDECPSPKELPLHLCPVLIHTWAVGGSPMFFPENAGYTLVENDEPVYIMYEIHIDNPEGLSNVTFDTAVEVYHTDKIREHEAAMLVVGASVRYTHVIPANINHFISSGHCGAACTAKKLKPDGINLFAVLHHAHLAGRQLRLRQFRDGKELAWVSADMNYAFDYQQNQPLPQERKVLPGDQLTIECTYQTTGRNNVTLGGLPSDWEMCEGILWYYPKDDLRFCESNYREEALMEKFGIEGIKWDHMNDDPTVTGPISIANKTLVEVLTTAMANWSTEQIAELEHEMRFGDHYQASCVKEYGESFKNTKRMSKAADIVSYPEIDSEYVPYDVCSGANNIFSSVLFIFGVLVFGLANF